MKKGINELDHIIALNLVEAPMSFAKAKEDTEEFEDGVDAAKSLKMDAEEIEAKVVNKVKFPVKVLLKLYDKAVLRIGSCPLQAIMDSKGDITKLGKIGGSKAGYYDILKNVIDVHKPVVEGMMGGNPSKYFEFYDKYIKVLTKEKNRFAKAFNKKEDNLVVSLYVSSVLFAFEMATILASETVHFWQKGSKDFDKLLETTDDYVKIFKGAERLWFGEEMDINKLIGSDLSITEAIALNNIIEGNPEMKELMNVEGSVTEAYVNDFIRKIDNASELDEFFQKELIESFNMNPSQSKAVGIVKIAKLLNFGLSVTLYNLFALQRYITYIYYYKKFTILQQMNLISASIDMFDGKAKNGVQRESIATDTVRQSIAYRVDVVESTNKATIDIVSKDKDKLDEIVF